MSKEVSGDCAGPSVLSAAARLATSDPTGRQLGAHSSRLPDDRLIQEFLHHTAPLNPNSFNVNEILTPNPSELTADGWADELNQMLSQQSDDWSRDLREFVSSQVGIHQSVSESWAHQLNSQLPEFIPPSVQSTDDNTITLADILPSLEEAWRDESARDPEMPEFASAAEAAFSNGGESSDEILERLQTEWENALRNFDSGTPWLDDVWREETRSTYAPQDTNPFRDIEDPLQKGIERLEAGDIANAVLLFEEAVRQNESSEQGWQFLGVAQAENENDLQAIQALNRALSLNPANLTALITLAASYTNENDMRNAVDTLRRWLHHNPKYQHLLPALDQSEAPSTSALRSAASSSFQSLTQSTLDLFNRALSVSSDDVSVLSALGILHCVRSDYASAADMFRQSVQHQPDNPLLWNRLGACLANGNQNEEAISAYRNALQLRPGYIRARYNLGVACSNLGSHREAAEHFIVALNLQASSSNPISGSSETPNTIWSTLTNAIGWLGIYPTLSSAIVNRDLPALNKHFDIQI